MNTDVLWPEPEWAEVQVLRIQAKLHQWANDDPDCRFDDLFNLVYDPAVLVLAWARVRGNRGKRSAGVDGVRLDAIFSAEEDFLPRLREDLKARQFSFEALQASTSLDFDPEVLKLLGARGRPRGKDGRALAKALDTVLEGGAMGQLLWGNWND